MAGEQQERDIPAALPVGMELLDVTDPSGKFAGIHLMKMNVPAAGPSCPTAARAEPGLSAEGKRENLDQGSCFSRALGNPGKGALLLSVREGENAGIYQ